MAPWAGNRHVADEQGGRRNCGGDALASLEPGAELAITGNTTMIVTIAPSNSMDPATS